LAVAIDMLLNHKELTVQDADLVASALQQFQAKPALGFSDCLVLEVARKAGHLPLGTFDRDLGKLEGAERI
jgi:predicted nucleic-acid-binding protein